MDHSMALKNSIRPYQMRLVILSDILLLNRLVIKITVMKNMSDLFPRKTLLLQAASLAQLQSISTTIPTGWVISGAGMETANIWPLVESAFNAQPISRST